MKLGIDPKWTFYLGIALVIEQAVGQGSVSLTNVVPIVAIPYVKAWSALLAFIGTAVMTALSGYSSNGAGPLVIAPPVPPAAKAVIALFAILVALSLLMTPGMATPAEAMAKAPDHVAYAAALKYKPARVHVAANTLPNIFAPIATPVTAPTDPFAAFMADLEKIKAEDVAGVITDIQAADKDAGTIITPAIPAQTLPDGTQIAASAPVVRDPISHTCYPAEVQFLQSMPVFNAPTGKFVVVQLFQKKRDFVAQLKAGLPTYLKIGCAPLLGDEINTFIQSIALLGIKVLPAGIAAICPPCALAAAPIALPALTLAP